jgi:hypothetical protein
MDEALARHAAAISAVLLSPSPRASATPSRAAAHNTQLGPKAIAISSRLVGAITFPIAAFAGILHPPFEKGMRFQSDRSWHGRPPSGL